MYPTPNLYSTAYNAAQTQLFSPASLPLFWMDRHIVSHLATLITTTGSLHLSVVLNSLAVTGTALMWVRSRDSLHANQWLNLESSPMTCPCSGPLLPLRSHFSYFPPHSLLTDHPGLSPLLIKEIRQTPMSRPLFCSSPCPACSSCNIFMDCFLTSLKSLLKCLPSMKHSHHPVYICKCSHSPTHWCYFDPSPLYFSPWATWRHCGDILSLI